jgi:transposase
VISEAKGVEVLRLVWIQQFYLDASLALHLRVEKSRPPARQQICSPYEVKARFSRKRQTEWVGL